MTRVYELPNWDLAGDFIEQYCKELKVVTTLDKLLAFVTRWRPIWEAEDVSKQQFVRDVDSRILRGDLSEDDLHCIRLSFEVNSNGEIGIICEHAELCPGMEIRMPWSQLRALTISQHFLVPVATAFHQAFCTDEAHRNCF